MSTQKENPCRKCAYCLPEGSHDWALNIDACIHPERLKQTGAEYRATNHEGENCTFYDIGKQTQLGEWM